MAKLTKKQKQMLNTIAQHFSTMDGFELEGEDFSKARHHQARSQWNKAVVAYAVITDDKKFIKHQISRYDEPR